MTEERFSDAITELDADILDRYFLVKQNLTEKKKAQKRAFIVWASLAACLALIITSGVMSIDADTVPSASAVIPYGPFIFMPILLVSLIAFCFKRALIPAAVALIVTNSLNVLSVYLYSHFGGFNITAHLPIILASSNIGILISLITITSLGRKPKPWWLKSLLCLLFSVIAIIIAASVHNLILALFSGDTFTIA